MSTHISTAEDHTYSIKFCLTSNRQYCSILKGQKFCFLNTHITANMVVAGNLLDLKGFFVNSIIKCV